MPTTYTETTYLVARSKTTGLPLTSASVQLKRGATTLTMSHKGQGLYEATGVPRGYWAVWIDGVDTGASHGVGVGKLEDAGHESGYYPRSTSGGWELVDLSGLLGDYIKEDGTSTTTASIPFAFGASFGAGISGTTASFTGNAKAKNLTSYGDIGIGDLVIRNATDTANRWVVMKLNAESTGNAGSDLALLARADDGSGIDTPITITRAAGGNVTLVRPLNLSQNNLSNVNRLSFSQVEGAFLTGQLTATIYSSTQNAGGSYPFTEAGNLIISPRTSVGRDVVISATGVNADFILDRSGNTQVRGNLLVKNAAKTFDYTIVGGAITANRQLNLPVISGTDTLATIGRDNGFTSTQTARAWALTSQSNSPASAYTWTLTSGNQANIDLVSSTGAVTITTASPSVGAQSYLRVRGHGTTARNVTLTQSGVTFVKAGVASGASILLDSIGALEEACYRLHWITATLCFVDRVNQIFGGMTLSGHQNVVTPWSIGAGATFNAISAGFQIDPVGTYGLHFKGNALIEQASGQALRVYRATSGATTEVCLPFALQDSLGNVEDYAEICARIDSSTSGSEKGTLILEYKQNGAMVQGAFLNEDGFRPVKRNVALTISSIFSGLNIQGATSGVVNDIIQEDGMFGYSTLLGGNGLSGLSTGGSSVNITNGDTLVVFTASKLIQFPRYHLASSSFNIGGNKLEFEVAVTGSGPTFTYTIKALTTFSVGANTTIVSSRTPLIGLV